MFKESKMIKEKNNENAATRIIAKAELTFRFKILILVLNQLFFEILHTAGRRPISRR